MEKEEVSGEEWDARIRFVCEGLREQTSAGAVMVVVFAAPWMKEKDGFLGTCTGIAGRQDAIDPRRMARELRETAGVLEAQAELMISGKPFEVKIDHPERGTGA